MPDNLCGIIFPIDGDWSPPAFLSHHCLTVKAFLI